MAGHSTALADDLRHRVRGRVIGGDDPHFPRASQGWSLAVRQDPVAVVEVTNAEDVAATIAFARRQGLAVSAQALGHAAASAVDGTILIRTTGLRQFTVDSGRATARVGAGVPVGTLLRALDGTGFIALAGSSPSPSMVAYLLGGGASWFGRRYGYAAHQIRSLDVVTADGDQAKITDDSDPDLYWALRGGGGDFAIVTSVELPLPRETALAGGRLMWPIARAGEVMAAYRELTMTAPHQLTAWLQLLSVPDLPDIPPPMRGQRFVTVDATFLGAAAAGRGLLAPVLAIGGSIMDSFAAMTIGNLGSVSGEPTEPGYAVAHGASIDRFDAAIGDALLDLAGPDRETPLVTVQVRHLGGAFAEPDPGGGVAGTLAEPYLCAAVAFSPDPPSAAAAAVGFADLDRAIAPAAAARKPFSVLAAGEPASLAFAPADLERLRQIKRARDPQRVIRSNHPVLD